MLFLQSFVLLHKFIKPVAETQYISQNGVLNSYKNIGIEQILYI